MREKVLILTPFYPPNIGGAETFAKSLYDDLLGCYHVLVCNINWRKQKIWAGTNFLKTLEIIPRLFFKSLRLMLLHRIMRVYALGLNSAFVAVMLKKIFNFRFNIIMLALYDFEKKPKWLQKIAGWVLNQADNIFVEGKSGYWDIMVLGRYMHKIKVFQHWCDQNIFKPDYTKRSEDKMRVLFIGRPIPEKGKWIIQEVEKKLKEVEFIYVENIPYKDLPQYYQMADVLVVPSLYSEGFPRVVIEAASCGCAVVTSDRGSLPEITEKWGISIIPIPDIFYSVLDLFRRNKEYLREYQEKAYNHAIGYFTNKNAEIFLYENRFFCK